MKVIIKRLKKVYNIIRYILKIKYRNLEIKVIIIQTII